ncbi:MAG: hypothetical protein JW904_15585 [Spirochaetales bacterium]|nr:hypothetical protein [Spirochaetales bacterium]
MENDIIVFSMYAGFMMIVLAPLFRLFSKAGEKGYVALIPGFNWVKANSFMNRKLSYLSIVSIVAVLALLYLVGFFNFTGDAGQIVFAVVLIVLSVYTVFAFYIYPMISTTIFILIAYLGALVGQFNPLFLLIFSILFIVGMGQAFLDFFNWIKLLREMSKPFWTIILLFLPTLTAFIFAAITLLSSVSGLGRYAAAEVEGIVLRPAEIYDMRILIVCLVPMLFTGFVYVYYLGYSTKTQFSVKK